MKDCARGFFFAIGSGDNNSKADGFACAPGPPSPGRWDQATQRDEAAAAFVTCTSQRASEISRIGALARWLDPYPADKLLRR